MHQQISAVMQDLAAARARWGLLSTRTPDAQWARRASPETWSVAENIAHLNLTARAMSPRLDAATEQARSRGAYDGRYRRSPIGWILSSTMGPVKQVLGMRLGRIKTPPPFVPTADESRAVISGEFEKHLAAHEEGLRHADGLRLHEVRIESPFAKGVHYDAWSGWLVLVRHIHRHLAQAERVWSG